MNPTIKPTHMKKFYFIIAIVASSILISFGCKNQTSKEVNEETKEFLNDMTDARLMDREEAKQAVAKGTTKEIKDYGELMIKEQTYLLMQLQEFAKTKNITLRTTISDKKKDALEGLKKETGKDLDKKFISMICIDHTRDVKEFKKATKSKDIELSKFASKHLPMIKEHLEKVKAIKKSYK